MELKKILSDLPTEGHGKEIKYKGLAFEERIRDFDFYTETESRFFVPFYVFPNRTRGIYYEIYEYGLDLVYQDEESFEEWAKRVLGVDSFENLPEDKLKIFNRMKICTVDFKEGDNILPALKRWLDYVLHGEEIRRYYDEFFGGFNPENIYFEVY